MTNINVVLELTIGELLELRQLLKNPDAKLWRYGAFKKLSRLLQGIKKQTIKGKKTIYFISPYQKPMNKKPTYV